MNGIVKFHHLATIAIAIAICIILLNCHVNCGIMTLKIKHQHLSSVFVSNDLNKRLNYIQCIQIPFVTWRTHIQKNVKFNEAATSTKNETSSKETISTKNEVNYFILKMRKENYA